MEGIEEVNGTVKAENGISLESMLKRGHFSLTDEEWDRADRFFEKALDINPESAEAYLGKLMAELQVKSQDKLRDQVVSFENRKNYQNALHFADSVLRSELEAYCANVKINIDKRLNVEKLALERKKTALKTVRNQLKTAQTLISANADIAACLYSNGTVASFGDSCKHQHDTDSWQDIIAISAGPYHLAGLRENGMVVAASFDTAAQRTHKSRACRVEAWQDIIAVSSGFSHTVGLRADGTVVATGNNDSGACAVENWENIVAISAGGEHTVGLREDGTVVATKYLGDPYSYYGQCEVSNWQDIVAISAGNDHTVGLRSDGTVVSTKHTGDYFLHKDKDAVDHWQDIVSVHAGLDCTMGLCADGTVVITGTAKGAIPQWRDIVAIAAGREYRLGLQQDGTVLVSNGSTIGKQLFCSLQSLEVERDTARKKREADRIAREAQRVASENWIKAGKCRHCGGKLRGLFDKKCLDCGRPKDF